jgi:hypothetical protein
MLPETVWKTSPDIEKQRSAFNIGQMMPDPMVTSLAQTYFNQDWVLADLGVPVNYTFNSDVVLNQIFNVTGDASRRTLRDLSYVAQSGVKVVLAYGDLDYRCNCESHSDGSL